MLPVQTVSHREPETTVRKSGSNRALGAEAEAQPFDMVSALTAVLSWTAFSTVGLLYNMDEGAAASLDPSKLHFSAPWPSSVGPAEAEAVRSAANLLVAHIVKSQLLGFALANFLLSMYALWACLTKEMFLGRLSIEESHAAMERLVRHVMIKAVFMSAVVETPDPAELAMWLAWFSIIAYMKCFVGLARDRFQGLMASPSATAGAHLRTLALLCLIVSYDLSWVAACASAFPSASLGQLFLWLHDTALIFIEAGQALASYAVHVVDRVRAAAAARGKEVAVWEGRGAFLYHVDAGGDIAAQALTLAHLAHIWVRAGFSFSLLDLILFMDIRALMSALGRKLRAFARHRAATRLLRDAYPDADVTRLAASREECAICRDSMQTAKVLPCGHLFHANCLREWLQTAGQANFTCPVCRTSLFATSRGNSQPHGQPNAGPSNLLVPAQPLRLQQRPESTGTRQSPEDPAAQQATDAAAAGTKEQAPHLVGPQASERQAAAAGTAAALAGQPNAAGAAPHQHAAGCMVREPAWTASAQSPPLPPPPLRRSLDSLLPAGVRLPAAAHELSAAAAVRAEQTLRAFASRLAAGRTSAAQQAERISTQLRQQLSAALAAAGDALLDGDNANGTAEPEITDSGALATRLLEAVLTAGLGVSEFDEMLSDEIASVASDDDVSASGGSLRDYQVQLEELHSLLWGQAVHFVGSGSGNSSGGGRSSSGRSSGGSGSGSDVAARI